MEFLNKKMGIILAMLIAVAGLIAQDTDKIVDAFKESYALEEDGEYKEAVIKLKEVYVESSYELNLRLGWLSYQAGALDNSELYYKKALKIMPLSIEAKLGLAYPLSTNAKWDELHKLYLSILEISPKHTLANYRLGLIHYNKAEYLKAKDYFGLVVELYPFDYDALLMYGWTHLQLGKYNEAKVLFNKVLMYSPDDASAMEGLSYIK